MKKLPYVSLDIETGGLVESLSLLEVALVIEDWVSPIDELKSLRILVHNSCIYGDPLALSWHHNLLAEIAKSKDLVEYFNVPEKIEIFLKEHLGNGPFLVAGKNASTFDIPFLRAKFGRERLESIFSHRVLDVGTLYYDPETWIPSSKILFDKITHNAIDDCKQVIRLIRKWNDFQERETKGGVPGNTEQ